MFLADTPTRAACMFERAPQSLVAENTDEHGGAGAEVPAVGGGDKLQDWRELVIFRGDGFQARIERRERFALVCVELRQEPIALDVRAAPASVEFSGSVHGSIRAEGSSAR